MITVSTVGYEEASRDVSDHAAYTSFVVALILGGVGTARYTLGMPDPARRAPPGGRDDLSSLVGPTR